MNIPLDGKAGDAWLLGKNLPLHLLNDGLGGGVECKCLVCVLVVHVVSDTDELALVIAAAKQNDGDTNDFAVGDAR